MVFLKISHRLQQEQRRGQEEDRRQGVPLTNIFGSWPNNLPFVHNSLPSFAIHLTHKMFLRSLHFLIMDYKLDYKMILT